MKQGETLKKNGKRRSGWKKAAFELPLLWALLVTSIPFLIFMRLQNGGGSSGGASGQAPLQGTDGNVGTAAESTENGSEAAAEPGFEKIPEDAKLPEEPEETEPVHYEIPDGVNSPVMQATDYGNTNTAYQAPAGTVFETAQSGIFAPDGTFYYLQSVPDDSYFADALFIGDSRTDGFRDYSSLKDVASFWAKESLSVFNVLDKSLPLCSAGIWEDSQTLQEVLSGHTYGKIYISMGINEIGMPTTVTYLEKYKELLEMIRQAEPDAILYVEGNMHVSKAFSSSDPVTNNVNLVERNAAIATLANGRDIFYLDMNPAVCDENGDLREELTGDGVHLKASAYELWADFLRQNAIVKTAADGQSTSADGNSAVESATANSGTQQNSSDSEAQ